MTDWSTIAADATGDIIDTFGVSATYYPSTGAQSTITVNFVRSSSTIETDNGSLRTFEASIDAKTSDLASAKEGDQIRINGVLYRFEYVAPDSDGATMVMLSAE